MKEDELSIVNCARSWRASIGERGWLYARLLEIWQCKLRFREIQHAVREGGGILVSRMFAWSDTDATEG